MLNLLNSAQNGFVGVDVAAFYALIGFSVVFVGIAFLILIVWLVGKFFDGNNKKESKKVVEKQEIPADKNVATVEPAVVPAEAISDVDEETVAMIMAALMAYYQTNNPKCEFTVKRIKRI